MKLYELSNQYRSLAQALEDGEIDRETAVDTLDGLSGELQDKVQACASMILSLELQAEAARAEKARVARIQKRAEEGAQWLRDYVVFHMEACGMIKVHNATRTISIQQGKPSVEIVEKEKIPEFYWRQKEPEVDKEAILKDGGCDGVAIVRKPYIRIY